MQTEWLPYFREYELQCRCGGKYRDCPRNGMDSAFMGKIMVLRSRCAFPFIVNSAYRCPQHNREVSHTGLDGPHTRGMAMDIRVYGEWARKLVRFADEMGFSGIGIQQGLSLPMAARFIHIDDVVTTQRRLWSYNA